MIKRVQGGIEADKDAFKILGQDSIDEHERLKLTRHKWELKGTMSFLDGIVLGGLGGFAPDVRSQPDQS